MREVLYRGKRLNNGEWVYGYLFEHNGALCIVTKENEDNVYPIDPDTVGEYTGYKDKNGKKLFTEDIITIEGEEGYFEIVWDEEKAKFAIENDTYSLEFDPYLYMDITLIGSAHDNPDLLVEVFER